MLFNFWQVMFLFFVVLLFLLLQRHLKNRERANQLVRQFCRQRQLQFLDGSVALETMRWHWARSGLIQRLSWRFEYTNGLGETVDSTGRIVGDSDSAVRSSQRRAGLLVMLGSQSDTFILPDDQMLEQTV